MFVHYRTISGRTGIFCYKAVSDVPPHSYSSQCGPKAPPACGANVPPACSPGPPAGCGSSGKSKHTVTYKAYVPPTQMDHDHKNMCLGRPMSPHLTIYGPTVTSMTSILQRITGLSTAACALLLSGGTLFLADGVETYVAILQNLELSRPTAFLAKLVLGAPFAYHYFNGIRFCMWNAGRMLAKKDIYDSANKAIIASAITAVLFALL